MAIIPARREDRRSVPEMGRIIQGPWAPSAPGDLTLGTTDPAPATCAFAPQVGAPAVEAPAPEAPPEPPEPAERSGRIPRPRHPRLDQAVALSSLGVLVVTAGVGLGYALTSPRPSLLARHPVAVAPVTGTEGLAPGGAPVDLTFTVVSTDSRPLMLSAIAPMSSELPEACPSAAWRLALRKPTTLVSAGVPTTVDATVALAADAPQSCEGLTVTLPAMLTATGPDGQVAPLDGAPAAPVVTATLGTPSITVEGQAGRVVIDVSAAPSGPTSTGYTVETAGRDGDWTTLCRLVTPGQCLGRTLQEEDGRRFRVTSHLGPDWIRRSTSVAFLAPQVTGEAPDGPSGSATVR